jgi:hypothetical protein
LEVIFFSQCEIHNDTNCISDGWNFRPDTWGKIVTIDIVSQLSPEQELWIQGRAIRKNEKKF